ncbi:hemolysin family protein [Devosia sp.]|jgi:CBS domain containing-hemolysin-like protein|uniref:hemolysin family protein n=1 Tax=Devosia sp. TaxID=1871048 RepID=UPI002DDCED63|nr:hemolysin family protein [Devosia sp.]
MNDSDSPSAPPKKPAQPKSSNEPPSSPAPAATWGQRLWQSLRGLIAMRTVSLRDDLEVALEAENNGGTADFTQSERTILKNVLDLAEKRVEDVMIPRADIEAIETTETLGVLVTRFRQVGHSRMPVYSDSLDNIIGFIHVKDALRRITEPVTDPEATVPVKLVSTPLRSRLEKLDLVRQVLFVPPLMPVGDLLQQMQLKRVHMAVVIDEYGGTDGLVTIEDLLEAVVGEIEDEHDDDVALVRKVNSNVFIASARAELEEVREVIGPDFDPGSHADEVDTLGGLVFELAGHVPAKGEHVNGIKGFEFEILQADSRQVKRVKIKRLKQPKPRPPKPPVAKAPEDNQAPAAE